MASVPDIQSLPFSRERTSAFNLSEPETDFLSELDDQLTSPSSFYAGTGGKPPLTFSTIPDTKSHRKR